MAKGSNWQWAMNLVGSDLKALRDMKIKGSLFSKWTKPLILIALCVI
jgi:hypothetical protein